MLTPRGVQVWDPPPSETGDHRRPEVKHGLWIVIGVGLVAILIAGGALTMQEGAEPGAPVSARSAARAVNPFAEADGEYENPLAGKEEANTLYVNPFAQFAEEDLDPNAPAENPFASPAP